MGLGFAHCLLCLCSSLVLGGSSLLLGCCSLCLCGSCFLYSLVLLAIGFLDYLIVLNSSRTLGILDLLLVLCLAILGGLLSLGSCLAFSSLHCLLFRRLRIFSDLLCRHSCLVLGFLYRLLCLCSTLILCVLDRLRTFYLSLLSCLFASSLSLSLGFLHSLLLRRSARLFCNSLGCSCAICTFLFFGGLDIDYFLLTSFFCSFLVHCCSLVLCSCHFFCFLISRNFFKAFQLSCSLLFGALHGLL